MNAAMAEEAICAALDIFWGDRTPIDWPNVDRDGPHLRDGDDPWIALHIRHDGSDQATLAEVGRRTFTRAGSLTVQVFTKAGERGLTPGTALAMEAANVFEGKSIDGVRFYRVGMRTAGRDGPWYQVNVEADFEFDEVK